MSLNILMRISLIVLVKTTMVMTNCRIFEDQYWEKIFKHLSSKITTLNFPIKNNIVSPILFIEEIQNGDIILLDNYFPWEKREEPLWDEFLQKYIEKWLMCKIICISDYWKVLCDKYIGWDLVNKKWDIIWYIPSKEPEEILKLLR